MLTLTLVVLAAVVVTFIVLVIRVVWEAER